MRRLHFDGAPDRFSQMRALFNQTSTLQQKPEWSRPVDRKFRLSRIAHAVIQWKRRHAA